MSERGCNWMPNLQDIIKLAGEGKVFVVDESGDVKLVILNIEDYQHLLLGKLKRQVQDIETINQEILNAQLHDELEPIAPAISKKAKELFKFRPASRQPDLRSEVIDPNFDLEANPDEEVIRPGFDDI